ncbi:MAG: methylenetetrahydrofolate reductase [Brucellaceae bacterium]|nr:methylenetetrahydrofolate reductase [Brucellaceae bacterium]
MQAQGVSDINASRNLAAAIAGYSIEVMPRTAAKIESFADLLPPGTRVYIANIEGTPFDDMVATARRIRSEGFAVMPHFPARLIADAAMLETWLKRYRDEAGVDEALVLGGGVSTPAGDLDNSMQLLETGLFDRYGFKRLHVAGHPEGNRDIDRDGSSRIVDEALKWKQAFSERTDAEMAITTQFFFDAAPVIAWAERLDAMGVGLPVHVGIAGPAKLQTMIKFAMACGVGPSVRVLKKRALDVSKLLVPYEPNDVLAALAAYRAANLASAIEQVHFFPLGGIKACVDWAQAKTAAATLAEAV